MTDVLNNALRGQQPRMKQIVQTLLRFEAGELGFSLSEAGETVCVFYSVEKRPKTKVSGRFKKGHVTKFRSYKIEALR